MGSQDPANDLLSGILDLATEIGKTVTLRQIVNSGTLLDATNPTKGYTQTTTNTSVTAIITEYSEADVDGTVINKGDRQIVISMSGETVTPAEGDLIVDGSSTWTLVHVQPLEVSGTTVVAIGQMRR